MPRGRPKGSYDNNVPQRLQKGYDGWRTPLDLAQDVRGVFGGSIGLDPCTEEGNHLRAEQFYTRDGLDLPWQDRTWCNPPFSQINDWMMKCEQEAFQGFRIGFLTSVSRTEVDGMQQLLSCTSCIQLQKGKLRFSDGDKPAMLASMVLWFNVDPGVVVREMGWRGLVLVVH